MSTSAHIWSRYLCRTVGPEDFRVHGSGCRKIVRVPCRRSLLPRSKPIYFQTPGYDCILQNLLKSIFEFFRGFLDLHMPFGVDSKRSHNTVVGIHHSSAPPLLLFLVLLGLESLKSLSILYKLKIMKITSDKLVVSEMFF